MTDQSPARSQTFADQANVASLFTASLAETDPEIADVVRRELGRQRDEIELIASENIVSKAVLEAQGSVSHQQICGGAAGAALLRRLPICRCRGKPCDRTGYQAFRM